MFCLETLKNPVLLSDINVWCRWSCGPVLISSWSWTWQTGSLRSPSGCLSWWTLGHRRSRRTVSLRCACARGSGGRWPMRSSSCRRCSCAVWVLVEAAPGRGGRSRRDCRLTDTWSWKEPPPDCDHAPQLWWSQRSSDLQPEPTNSWNPSERSNLTLNLSVFSKISEKNLLNDHNNQNNLHQLF